MKNQFPPEWRTQSKWKRKFYARYMTWMERIGYTVVALVIGAFIFAFNYRVDDIITADKVAITAASVAIKAEDQTLVVRQLVEDFSDVQANQPVLEIVTGKKNIDQYTAWNAVQLIGSKAAIAKPPVTIISAPSSGTFVVAPDAIGKPVEPEAELGQIRDYNDLRMKPTLTGQGVAKAVASGVATLKTIVVDPAAGVLMRGNYAGTAIISGQLINQATKDEVQAQLSGTTFKVRDDLPLQFTELSELQVDADLNLGEGTGLGTLIEPPAATQLKAEVIAGKHVATVQFAALPAELQASINEILKNSIEQKSIVGLDNNLKLITEASNLNTVFKVKAEPDSGTASSNAIAGTAISRGFEAELKIQSPPAYLIQAVRNADANGKTVTAKVELKTGDRPIATLLLKRS